MINTDTKYMTRCGYPVRNLHAAGFTYEGEYLANDHWFLGSWLIDGKPELWTTDQDVIFKFTLVEFSEAFVKASNVQGQLRLEGF